MKICDIFAGRYLLIFWEIIANFASAIAFDRLADENVSSTEK